MKRNLLTLIGFFVFAGVSWSQLAMTRTTFSGTYTPIATGTGATLSTITGDDAGQNTVPIGFTFNYLGSNYTTVGINANGWLSFTSAGTTGSSWVNANFYNTTAPVNVLAPWWDDLYVTGTGSVLYQVQGTPGSQTFTVQWTNVNSYQNTAPFNIINFQVVLFEGTNVIEFRYGSSSLTTPNTANESACIGLKNGTGGNNNYLDAVTGSATTGNFMLNSQTKWPTLFYRFTPGAPTPIAAGTYTVGVGQTYPTLSEAVADLNHRGVAGAVTLSLTDANYNASVAGGHNIFPILLGPVSGTSLTNIITIMPASGTSTVSSEGWSAGNCINQTSTTAFGTGNEPIMGLVGSQYTIIRNLNLTCSATGQVDRGIGIINSSTTLGSQFNLINGVNVTLTRTNTSSIGIEQRIVSAPASLAGTNSANAYSNFTISNVFAGMLLSGNAAFPDLNCIVGTTNPTAYNVIGGATANDIGNGSGATYGLQLLNQAADTVRNTEIRNVTVTGNNNVDGIFLNGVSSTTSIFNNKIHDIRNTNTGFSSQLTGIRANVVAALNHTVNIYNNFIYNLSSGYTGAATATVRIRGIWAQAAGGGTNGSVYNISFNNISLDGSGSANLSNSCFEIGTTTGPVMNVRNNIFANFTGAQTGAATHFAWRSNTAASVGSAGSVSNFNDLYIANTTNGFVGQGAAVNYATLLDWQTATVQDANSIAVNPSYVSNTSDLHVTSISLIGAGTPIAGITTDIDNALRAATPTIGADEIVACASASGGTVAPTTFTICNGQTVAMTSTGATTGGGISYQWMVSNTPGGPYSNVVGGSGATTTSYTSGALTTGTYYFVLQTTCAVGPVSGLSNEVTVTVNPIPSSSASSNSPICVGQTLNLTGTTDVGTGFIWSGPNSFSSTSQNPSIGSVTTLAAGTYSFTTYAAGCTSSVATTNVIVNVNPTVSANATPSVICAGNPTDLSSLGTLITPGAIALSENFNGAAPGWTTINNSTGGTPALAAWTLRPNAYAPGGSFTGNLTSNDNSQFYMTNSDAPGNGSTTITYLQSPVIDASTFTTLSLQYFHHYNYFSQPDSAILQVSTNGTTWTPLQTFSGTDVGGQNAFATATVNLNAYAGSPTLSLRWYYRASWDFCWAIDNVTVTGNQNVPTSIFSWTSTPAGFSSSVQNPTGVIPTGTTTYEVTTTGSNGCTATATTTVTVNPVVVYISPIDASCFGYTDGSFNIDSVDCGLAPFTFSVNGGAFGPIPTNLAAGTYSVIARDDNGINGDSVSLVIGEPTLVADPLSTTSDTVCTGTGSVMITATPAGATTISWWDSPTGGVMQGTGTPFETVGTGVMPTTNIAGVYTFYAQGQNGACASANRVPATVTLFDVIATLSPVNISCNGANDGSFTLGAVTCGNPGFTYSVNGGAFGPIPTNLAPGSYTVVMQDNLGGLSGEMDITLTEPSWIVPAPTTTGEIICEGDPSAILTGSISVPDTITIFLPFNVASQPTEGVADPGTLFSTVNLPAIPAGANIISAQITYPGLNAQGGSWQSEVRISLSGAIGSVGTASLGVPATGGGIFTYTRPITPASINFAGGVVNLGYWESYNDVVVPDAIFPLGSSVGNITIKYLPAANITWWDASTAGTNLASNDSIEAVGTSVLPNTNTPGIYNFYAQAEYNGCFSSTRTVATVNVGAYPLVNLGPDSSYCVTHNLDAGNPGLTYLWNNASVSQMITALDTGIYWVDVTSSLGCTTRDSIMLTINPLPVVNLGPDTTSCGSYTLDPGPQYPGSTYLWTDLSSNPTLVITTSGDYDVTVTDVNGCSNSDDITVNVPPITYNDLGPDTTLCTNVNGFMLDASTVGVTYEWQDGSNGPTFFVNLPGTYWCTITNFAGCPYTDTVVVTSVNPVQTNIAVNFITMSSATLDAGSGFSSYLWSTTAGTQVITVNANGTYYVEVMDDNNCITTDTVNIIFSLGVFNPNGSQTTMKLYPNPSEGVFNVSIDNLETSDLVMDVLDMNGRVVYNRYVGSVSGSTIEPFSLTNLRAGTYNLRLTANGKSSSLRFIIK